MKITSKTMRRFLFWSPVLLLLILAVLFPVRNAILRKALLYVTGRLKTHHLVTHWDGASFRGLKTVFIKGVYIQEEKGENEMYIDSLGVNVRILPLLLKNIRIKRLECSKISLRYVASIPDTLGNLPARHDSAGIFRKFAGRDLADLTNRYIRRSFLYLPSRTRLGLIECRLTYANKTSRVGFINLEMIKGAISGALFLAGEGRRIEIPLTGRFDKKLYLSRISLVNTSRELLPVPFLLDKYGIESGFDTLDFSLDLSERSRHAINLSGEFNFSGFVLKGERLATESIKIDRFRSSFLAHLGAGHLELDSSTTFFLNRIRLKPFFRLRIDTYPRIDIKLLPVNWMARDFFSSLPAGMFTSLNGLRAEGIIRHRLDFSVDMNNPDSLEFTTTLTSDDFKIVGFGKDDYRILNGTFKHEVFERGKLKTAFLVGPVNPDFVSIGQISPFLRAAVMTSEDGSFYFHQGFNPEAFRASIVTNIKEKRFARGGSTISMQLVKNVFLTRNKTVARKIEEALIVWLIENQNLVPKNRLYEVYLNLIEWGPGVYGIGQASQFYFNKKPNDLNLAESIFLASIVPHPKWYKYSFEHNGVPKPFFGNYFHRMEELMVKKKFIEAMDTIAVNPIVTLTGPAAQALSVSDSIRTDPVILQEIEMLPATIKLKIREQ